MARVIFFFCSIILALSLAPECSAVSNQSCKTAFALQPLDSGLLRLLGGPVAPANPALFADANFQQLRNWNFPSKVMSWDERPSAEEISRRQQQLVAASSQKAKSHNFFDAVTPYDLQPLAAADWKELEKWFAKDGPKKIPGFCADQQKPAYVLAVGLIGLPGATHADDSLARVQYQQATVSADTSFGPNAATQTPGGNNRPSDQLEQMGANAASAQSVYSCAYLYRVKDGTRDARPSYYYCHSGSAMPKSAVTTMLKYFSKAALP